MSFSYIIFMTVPALHFIIKFILIFQVRVFATFPFDLFEEFLSIFSVLHTVGKDLRSQADGDMCFRSPRWACL